jgi:uncharacterized protein DUF6529
LATSLIFPSRCPSSADDSRTGPGEFLPTNGSDGSGDAVGRPILSQYIRLSSALECCQRETVGPMRSVIGLNFRRPKGGFEIPIAAALVGLGGFVSVCLGAYAAFNPPTGLAVRTLGFNSLIEMKSWLATAAAALGILQVITATGMWCKLPGVSTVPRWIAPLHRWSGTIAFLLVLPVAYHCLWSLGYQTYSLRVAVHSALGCAFFGLFSAKMLALRLKGLPGIVLPLLGGGLFGILAVLWATSSYWYFTNLA